MLRVNLKKNNELIKLILTFNSVNPQPFLHDIGTYTARKNVFDLTKIKAYNNNIIMLFTSYSDIRRKKEPSSEKFPFSWILVHTFMTSL